MNYGLAGMKFAKIRFQSQDVCAKALQGMMQIAKVVGLRDQVFIVPERVLEWLAAEKLPYKLVQRMSQDAVVKALRSNLAHPVA